MRQAGRCWGRLSRRIGESEERRESRREGVEAGRQVLGQVEQEERKWGGRGSVEEGDELRENTQVT